MSRAGERLTLVVERLVAGGDALARDPAGKVVFVTGALPGEVVQVEVTTSRRDFARARVVEVVEPSADRRVPPCPHVARGCGGCTWQHLAMGAQREARREIVRDALRRIAKLPDARVELAPPLGSGSLRTTMRAGVDPLGRLGLRARQRNDVVALDDCLVAHPRIVDLLSRVRLPGADEVVMRCSDTTGERLMWWTAERKVVPEGLPRDVLVGPEVSTTETVDGATLRVSATSFFQPSRVAAEALVGAVRSALGPIVGDAVFVDAYGGVGLFAATVGVSADQVVIVEESASSCADARVNLARVGRAGRQVQIVCSRVEEWTPSPWTDEPVRWTGTGSGTGAREVVVVADPARAGLGVGAVDVLATLGADRLVLVSCDAAALARDTALLGERGYRHDGSTVLDQFPHTHHVEVVTSFVRQTAHREGDVG